MTSESSFDRRRFVRAIVVHYEMRIQVRRRAGVDGAPKAHEFASAIAPMCLADYFTSQVQRCEQGDPAAAHVIVGVSLRNVECQPQLGLRAIEHLDRDLFVHARHHGIERRISATFDDISHLVNEHRTTGKRERFMPMGLQTQATPDPRDCRPRPFHFTSHRADAPVSRSERPGLERLRDGHIDARVITCPRCGKHWCNGRSLDHVAVPTASKPSADRLAARCNGLVVHATGAGKNDARSVPASARSCLASSVLAGLCAPHSSSTSGRLPPTHRCLPRIKYRTEYFCR
jgi:hypothetical protein